MSVKLVDLVAGRVVLVGTLPDRRAGFPVPGYELWDSVRCSETWPERVWSEVTRYYDAVVDPGMVPLHDALSPASCIMTSSVLGLYSSEHVVEWCGSLHRLRCTGCGEQREIIDADELYLLSDGRVPECLVCGAIEVPDICAPDDAEPCFSSSGAGVVIIGSEPWLVEAAASLGSSIVAVVTDDARVWSGTGPDVVSIDDVEV